MISHNQKITACSTNSHKIPLSALKAISIALAMALSIAPLGTASADENAPTASPSGQAVAEASADIQIRADSTPDAWDFFASLPNGYGEDAIKVLNESPLKEYTHKGNESDATSLSNMTESIQWLKKCNQLRAANDLPALKVNYTLVAIAMTDANWSLTHVDHAKAFNVGENLSWGYPDPFVGWYDEEKVNFDTKNGKPTGHYLNIINPLHKENPNAVTYTTTGFAIADGGEFRIEHAQVFGSDTSTPGLRAARANLTLGNATKNGTVSVEEYERQLTSFAEDAGHDLGNSSGDLPGNTDGNNNDSTNNGNSNSGNNNSNDNANQEPSKKTYDAWDFFEQLPNGYGEDAIKVLNESPLKEYTHKGSESDATSLSNMRESVQWLKKCNQLRAANGLDPLKVNYTLVAIAMTDANYSLTHIEHARAFKVGENLSWGHRDPFVGWYDEENVNFDTKNGKPTGHYLNIINPLHKENPNTITYTTTGFAIADGGQYGIEHAQVFNNDTSIPELQRARASLAFGNATKNGTVSVEEYERQLNSFIEENQLNVPFNEYTEANEGNNDSGNSHTDGNTNNAGDVNRGNDTGMTDAKANNTTQEGTPLAHTGDAAPFLSVLPFGLIAAGVSILVWIRIRYRSS